MFSKMPRKVGTATGKASSSAHKFVLCLKGGNEKSRCPLQRHSDTSNFPRKIHDRPTSLTTVSGIKSSTSHPITSKSHQSPLQQQQQRPKRSRGPPTETHPSAGLAARAIGARRAGVWGWLSCIYLELLTAACSAAASPRRSFARSHSH